MRTRRPKNLEDSLAEVRAVYAEVDARPAERSCTRLTECCQFKLTGSTPLLTRGEALVAARALRAAGRKDLPKSVNPATGACPMLDARGKCIIYQDRPFGCRTHFCDAAGGPLARRDVLDLIRRLEVVDEDLGGDGSHALTAALEAVLLEMGNQRDESRRVDGKNTLRFRNRREGG